MKVQDLLLYHWSPTSRRNSIIRSGLLPRQEPVFRDELMGNWRAPYVCLSPSPSLAWTLSVRRDRDIVKEWDLWMVSRNQLNEADLEYTVKLEDLGRGVREIKEIRVMERIYKRYVWYVGTRIEK